MPPKNHWLFSKALSLSSMSENSRMKNPLVHGWIKESLSINDFHEPKILECRSINIGQKLLKQLINPWVLEYTSFGLVTRGLSLVVGALEDFPQKTTLHRDKVMKPAMISLNEEGPETIDVSSAPLGLG
jgi:hypothetical protein